MNAYTVLNTETVHIHFNIDMTITYLESQINLICDNKIVCSPFSLIISFKGANKYHNLSHTLLVSHVTRFLNKTRMLANEGYNKLLERKAMFKYCT